MLPVMLVSALMLLTATPQDDVLAEARRLVAQTRWTDAERLLREALQDTSAPEREVRLLLAETVLREGRAREAIDVLEDLDGANDYEVLLVLGEAHLAWADGLAAEGASQEDIELTLADGRGFLEKAVGVAPSGDTRGHAQLGYCELYRYQDPARTLEVVAAGLSTSPEDGEMLLLRGCARGIEYWNLAQAGDDGAANEAWNAAVDDLLAADRKLGKERVEPWGQLAFLYEAKGIPLKAVEAAVQIVNRQRQPNLDTLYRLAQRYGHERRWDAAGKAMEKLIAASPREVTARLKTDPQFEEMASLMAGSVDSFQARGDLVTARNILAAIVAAEPKDIWIWDNFAFFCRETQQYEDAVAAYEKRITIDGSDPRTYNDMAAILHHDLDRDLDRCAEMYEKCIAMVDEELQRHDLTDQRRAHLLLARSTAQDNLSELRPAPGLLDSVLQGLSSLKLPPLPASEPESDGQAGGGEQPGSGDDGGSANGTGSP